MRTLILTMLLAGCALPPNPPRYCSTAAGMQCRHDGKIETRWSRPPVRVEVVR